MINKNTSISIVGGGIGGLVLAIALRQKGFDPIIYERTPELKPVGSGIVLSFNAILALKKLGVSQKIIEVGRPVSSFNIQTPPGEILQKTDFEKYTQKYGVPAIGISRSALHRLLADALPIHTLKLGYELDSLNTTDTSTQMIFKNSKKIDTTLLIGADGLHSKVRRELFGQPTLRYSGQTGWRGLSPLPRETNLNSFFESWGIGKRFGAVQIDKDLVYWYAGINEEPRRYEEDKGKIKQTIMRLFQGWHAPIQELIQLTDPLHILPTDIFDIKPSSLWFKHNVVLLGDAIHPTTPNLGQGAGMAIESALVLAHCISEHDHATQAFNIYQKCRQKRTAWVTQQSWNAGKLAQLNTSLSYKSRNQILKMKAILIPNLIQDYLTERLFNYSIEF